MLTYAIGDVHGCLDRLVELLAAVGRDAAGRPHRLVCLGDYVDRGPDSAGVVALLRAAQAKGDREVICLKGNHEDLLGRAVHGSMAERAWWLFRCGGRETVASFGGREVEELPADAVAWLVGRPTWFDDGRRYFVHAGLNPAFPRDEQSDADRLWIRAEFLDSPHDFGRFVVHGHTPIRSGRPEIGRHRVNLDTAAVYGGCLTAGIFVDGRDAPSGFLQA